MTICKCKQLIRNMLSVILLNGQFFKCFIKDHLANFSSYCIALMSVFRLLFWFLGGWHSLSVTSASPVAASPQPTKAATFCFQTKTFEILPQIRPQTSVCWDLTDHVVLPEKIKMKNKQTKKTNIQFSREQAWTNSRTPGALRIPLWEPLTAMLHLCFEF